MGSFRSQPDTNKHTYEMHSLDHSYAVTHMCGILLIILRRMEEIYGRRQYDHITLYVQELFAVWHL